MGSGKGRWPPLPRWAVGSGLVGVPPPLIVRGGGPGTRDRSGRTPVRRGTKRIRTGRKPMAFSRGTPHSGCVKKSFHVATFMKCLFQINHNPGEDVKQNGGQSIFGAEGLAGISTSSNGAPLQPSPGGPRSPLGVSSDQQRVGCSGPAGGLWLRPHSPLGFPASKRKDEDALRKRRVGTIGAMVRAYSWRQSATHRVISNSGDGEALGRLRRGTCRRSRSGGGGGRPGSPGSGAC